MSKKVLALALIAALAVIGGCSQEAAPIAPEVSNTPEVSPQLEAAKEAWTQAELEVVDFYTAQRDNGAYGGIFYEGDTLVVNLVEGAAGADKLIRETDGDMAVEYRTVRYSLAQLESVKNSLSRYMSQYSIQAVDANEVTNQVDVYVGDFTPENLDAIRALVEEYSDIDCLHFEDYSGKSIQFT